MPTQVYIWHNYFSMDWKKDSDGTVVAVARRGPYSGELGQLMFPYHDPQLQLQEIVTS